MLRRVVVAGLALVLGAVAAGALLLYSRGSGGAVPVYALTRDLPAGATLTPDLLATVDAAAGPAQLAQLVGPADRRQLLSSRARHQLAAGQLLQRSDLEPASDSGGDALVAVPLKNLPGVRAGDRVDLFAISGSGPSASAEPFAWAVPVEAVTADGLVLRVPGRQELAFVYAAGVMRLYGTVAGAAAAAPGGGPIDSEAAALAAVAG